MIGNFREVLGLDEIFPKGTSSFKYAPAAKKILIEKFVVKQKSLNTTDLDTAAYHT
jgi:hypothetical protein